MKSKHPAQLFSPQPGPEEEQTADLLMTLVMVASIVCVKNTFVK